MAGTQSRAKSCPERIASAQQVTGSRGGSDQRGAGLDTEVLMMTTPVWVGPTSAAVALEGPLPMAVHTLQCPNRQAMAESHKVLGLSSRIVLESHFSQALKVCVEAGLAVSSIDRGRVTERMQILTGMPVISDQVIVLVRSPTSRRNKSVELLENILQQSFRL